MTDLILKEFDVEGVTLFLTNVKEYLYYFSDLSIYATTDGENAFIKADISHDSLHDVKIYEIDCVEFEDVGEIELEEIAEEICREIYAYAHFKRLNISIDFDDLEDFKCELRELEALTCGTDKESVHEFLIKLNHLKNNYIHLHLQDFYLVSDVDGLFSVKNFVEFREEYVNLNWFFEKKGEVQEDDVNYLCLQMDNNFFDGTHVMVENEEESEVSDKLYTLNERDVTRFFTYAEIMLEEHEDDAPVICYDKENHCLVVAFEEELERCDSLNEVVKVEDYLKSNRIDDFISDVEVFLDKNDFTLLPF